jgi:transcriptional regulator with XRE-family HTH domain
MGKSQLPILLISLTFCAALCYVIYVMSIGEKIRGVRNGNGWTLKELAGRVGISIPYLSDVERDRTYPSLATLYKLTAALGMSLSQFFEDIEPPAGEVEPMTMKEQNEMLRQYSQRERQLMAQLEELDRQTTIARQELTFQLSLARKRIAQLKQEEPTNE